MTKEERARAYITDTIERALDGLLTRARDERADWIQQMELLQANGVIVGYDMGEDSITVTLPAPELPPRIVIRCKL